jgi:endo-1,4-beta-xylanase
MSRRCCTTAAVLAAGVAALAAASELTPLKDVMPSGTLIGVALNGRQSDGRDAAALAIVTRHFSSITPENLLKWEAVHPEPGRYAFEPADRLVALGERHGLAVVGHVLVWHQQTPAWVFAGPGGGRADRETLLGRLRAHIDAVVGRYKGRIRGWDVVNEALDEDGTLRKTPWLEILGEEYIARAFEYAHAADPQAELYYNDFNLWKPQKRAAAIALVKRLQARGLRVDGIGEQAHWGLAAPTLPEIDTTIRAIGDAGIKVLLTELDVDVLPRDPDQWGADLAKKAQIRAVSNLYPNGLPESKQQELARYYAGIFRLVREHRAHVTRVTFWGVTDAQSWLHNFPIPGRVNYPLLWDRDGRPKPAFHAVVEALRE